MQRRRMAIAASVVATALVSACGGSSGSSQTPSNPAASFKSHFVPVVDKLRDTSKAIGAEIEQASSQSNGQVLRSFRGLATRWQSQLSQLETLKPPSNLGTVFNTLTGAANRVESDLNAVVSAALTNSQSDARQAGASLVIDILSAKSASTTITNKLGAK